MALGPYLSHPQFLAYQFGQQRIPLGGQGAGLFFQATAAVEDRGDAVGKSI